MADIDQLVVVPNTSDQSILVATDVEDRQGAGCLRSNSVSVRVILSSILQVGPLSMGRSSIPLPKGFLGVGVLLPECPQGLEADDSHLDILSNRRPSVKNDLDKMSKSVAGPLIGPVKGQILCWMYEERLTTPPSGGAFGIRSVFRVGSLS